MGVLGGALGGVVDADEQRTRGLAHRVEVPATPRALTGKEVLAVLDVEDGPRALAGGDAHAEPARAELVGAAHADALEVGIAVGSHAADLAEGVVGVGAGEGVGPIDAAVVAGELVALARRLRDAHLGPEEAVGRGHRRAGPVVEVAGDPEVRAIVLGDEEVGVVFGVHGKASAAGDLFEHGQHIAAVGDERAHAGFVTRRIAYGVAVRIRVAIGVRVAVRIRVAVRVGVGFGVALGVDVVGVDVRCVRVQRIPRASRQEQPQPQRAHRHLQCSVFYRIASRSA